MLTGAYRYTFANTGITAFPSDKFTITNSNKLSQFSTFESMFANCKITTLNFSNFYIFIKNTNLYKNMFQNNFELTHVTNFKICTGSSWTRIFRLSWYV